MEADVGREVFGWDGKIVLNVLMPPFLIGAILTIAGMLLWSIFYLSNWSSFRLRRQPMEARWVRLNQAFDHGGDHAEVIPLEVKFTKEQIKQLALRYGFEYRYFEWTSSRYGTRKLYFDRVRVRPTATGAPSMWRHDLSPREI